MGNLDTVHSFLSGWYTFPSKWQNMKVFNCPSRKFSLLFAPTHSWWTYHFTRSNPHFWERHWDLPVGCVWQWCVPQFSAMFVWKNSGVPGALTFFLAVVCEGLRVCRPWQPVPRWGPFLLSDAAIQFRLFIPGNFTNSAGWLVFLTDEPTIFPVSYS